jgi:hypothetical protein
MGIAPNTRAGYDVAQRSYLEWSVQSKTAHPLPARPTYICEWIASLAARGKVSPGTIRGYISGLRSLHTDTGLSDAAFDAPMVDRVFRGIRRTIGERDRRKRLPITLPILVRILRALRSIPMSPADLRCLSAAYALAYVGGLRCGEVTYDSFDPSRHLSRVHVRDLGTYMVILLPTSKTDPFRRGVEVVVPSAPPGAPVDPLGLIRAHLAAIPPHQVPLFTCSQRITG